MSLSHSDNIIGDHHQFAIPNLGISDQYEWLQYINRVLSLFACIWLHFSIASRLLIVNKFRIKSDYQFLIVIQSVVNIVSCVFDFIVNEIQTQNLYYVKIGHPFWRFSTTERLIYIICMTSFSTSSQDVLMLFNLHRLFIIKKKNLAKLYAIGIPIMLIGPIGDAYTAYPVILAGRDVDLFVKHSQVPIISIVIVVCYKKLKKEFAINQSYSERTKRLQQKLSLSILMQLGLLCIISAIITLIPWIIELLVDPYLYARYTPYYIIYSLVICQWYSFCSAALITWSIAGFFKNQSPLTTIQHSDVKMFQVERKKFGARKQSEILTCPS